MSLALIPLCQPTIVEACLWCYEPARTDRSLLVEVHPAQQV